MRQRRAILLVDHGSVRHEANTLLVEVAALVAAQAPEYLVRVAHMEIAEPTIAQGLEACVGEGAEDVTVHPYMLAPGRHATLDIPRLVEEAARRHPHVRFRIAGPLGLDPRLAEVVLARVRQAERRLS